MNLHCGDCLEVMQGLPDNSVDLVLTDPPYFKVKQDAWDRQWDDPNVFIQWLASIVDECARLLRPNGSLYCFASPRMSARVECMIAERLNVLNNIRWDKNGHHTGGIHKRACKDELRGFVFEPLRAYLAGEMERAGFDMVKVNQAWREWRGGNGGMSSHWFTTSQWALPTEENYNWLRALFNADGDAHLRREYAHLRREYEDLRREYEDLRRPFAVSADSQYTDTWHFPVVQTYQGKHPCEKPLSMMEHIITASSRPGAVVLDPFMGSGTTGIACRNLGREFIGIERDPDYFKLAEARISHTPNQLELPG